MRNKDNSVPGCQESFTKVPLYYYLVAYVAINWKPGLKDLRLYTSLCWSISRPLFDLIIRPNIHFLWMSRFPHHITFIFLSLRRNDATFFLFWSPNGYFCVRTIAFWDLCSRFYLYSWYPGVRTRSASRSAHFRNLTSGLSGPPPAVM